MIPKTIFSPNFVYLHVLPIPIFLFILFLILMHHHGGCNLELPGLAYKPVTHHVVQRLYEKRIILKIITLLDKIKYTQIIDAVNPLMPSFKKTSL